MRGLLASSSSCGGNEDSRERAEGTRIQIHYRFNIANFDLSYVPHDLSYVPTVIFVLDQQYFIYWIMQADQQLLLITLIQLACVAGV
jgi:hypothetical protein